jgi:hypothetical protein
MYIYLQKNNLMAKTNYALIAGVILQSADSPDVYTNANLTDEAAEKYLKDNPGRIKVFSHYPEDWKKRAGLETEAEKEPSEAEKELVSVLSEKLKAGETKTALKETFKEYELDGEKVTFRALDEYINKAKEQDNP